MSPIKRANVIPLILLVTTLAGIQLNALLGVYVLRSSNRITKWGQQAEDWVDVLSVVVAPESHANLSRSPPPLPRQDSRLIVTTVSAEGVRATAATDALVERRSSDEAASTLTRAAVGPQRSTPGNAASAGNNADIGDPARSGPGSAARTGARTGSDAVAATSLVPTTGNDRPARPPATVGRVAPAATPSNRPECPDRNLLNAINAAPASSVRCARSSFERDATHPVTLVTGYYLVESKRTHATYVKWLELFLLRIRTPVAFFTDCRTLHSAPGVLRVLRERKRRYPARVVADIMELEGTDLAREFGPAIRRQGGDDSRRDGHSYLLYLVWLMKSEAVAAAVAANRFCSEWFLWVDSGAFRGEHPLRNWPSPQRLALVPRDRVLFALVAPFTRQRRVPARMLSMGVDWQSLTYRDLYLYSDHMAGGFIGVNVRNSTVRVFREKLADTYRLFVKHDARMVKDQAVFHAMFLTDPTLFALVETNWDCGDAWYHMEPWLADPKEMRCKNLSPLQLY